ncbi:MAG TPA: hypothetical protein VK999_08990, partial [Methylotenera sp.]|nr:hypothetical protein [Methylotenera sp.]
ILLASNAVKAISWTVQVVNQSGASAPQVAYVEFTTDGRLLTSAESGLLWYPAVVSGIGNDYEIYAELSAGPGGGATFDEWLSLSTLRRWEVTSNVGVTESDIIFSIRKAGEVPIMHSAQISLIAEVLV